MIFSFKGAGGAEFIKFFEAVTVDYLLEFAVKVMPDLYFGSEHKALTVFPGVRMPLRQALHIGIAGMSKDSPLLRQAVSQPQVAFRRIGQIPTRQMQRVEAEVKFSSMGRYMGAR